MRLLLVTQYFWPETFIVNDLVLLLQARGIEVTVLTGKPNYPGGKIFDGYKAGGVQRENFAGVEIVRVPIVPRGQKSRIRLAANYLSFIVSASLFGLTSLRGRPFDAVLVFGVSPLIKSLAAIVLAKVKRAALVVWVQDLWPESLTATKQIKSRFILRAVGSVVRFIYRRADLVLVQSRAFVDPVAVYCDRRDKIRYYPNFYKVPERTALSPEGEALAQRLKPSFSVVFAGNIGSAQDPETILEAARLLQAERDVTIVLVGTGSKHEWLADQIASLGLRNLLLPGRFAPEEMPAIFAAASALLVTLAANSTFAATVPSKVQAYLAAGRPIVAALDGEAARIIEEAGAGLSVAAGHADRLAAAIRKLFQMTQAERDALGKNGRAYFEQNFEPSKLTDDLIVHLTDAVTAKGNAT